MNRKKKVIINISMLLILGFALLAVVGCSTGDSNKQGEPKVEQKVDVKVLSEFPKEFMPLYKVARVNHCNYDVREPASWVYGKDIYSIEFESTAEMDEIADYYKDLLDTYDEEASYDDYNFEGTIGEQRVMFSIREDGYTDAAGPTVYITFGVPQSEYQDTNKYFKDYPEELIDRAFVSKALRFAYHEDYYYSYKRYDVSYQTVENPDTIVAHYRKLYESAADYKELKNQYGTTFSWTSGDYKCTISYTDSTGTDMILLSVEKGLDQ